MVLLAHWPIDDGYLDGPTVTRDIAGGGSGAHDGEPMNLSSSYDYANYRPGGVGGHHIHKRGNSYDGAIRAIANPSDFHLFGELAVSAWICPDDYYHWYTHVRVIACCDGDHTTGLEADNTIWDFRTNGSATNGRGLSLRWQYGAGVEVRVHSIAIPSWPIQGWFHVAAERYEVTPGFWGVRFYLNGAQVDDQNNGGLGWAPPTGGANALPFIARRYASPGGYREWFYDSVRVYDAIVGESVHLADVNADIAAGQIGTPGDGGALKTDWPTRPLASELVGVPGDHFPMVPSGPLSFREGAGWSEQ